MLHARIIERIRGEYLEMPGLRLTVAQAERLCGVEQTLCRAVLDALVDAGFLVVTPTGVYGRATEGGAPPSPRRRQMKVSAPTSASRKMAS